MPPKKKGKAKKAVSQEDLLAGDDEVAKTTDDAVQPTVDETVEEAHDNPAADVKDEIAGRLIICFESS